MDQSFLPCEPISCFSDVSFPSLLLLRHLQVFKGVSAASESHSSVPRGSGNVFVVLLIPLKPCGGKKKRILPPNLFGYLLN